MINHEPCFYRLPNCITEAKFFHKTVSGICKNYDGGGGGLLPLHIPTYTKVKQYQKMAIWHSLPVPFVLGSTCQAAPPPFPHYATEVSEKFVSLVLCNSDCT